MRVLFYLLVFYLNLSFYNSVCGGKHEIWKNIKTLTNENDISVYDDNFRKKAIQIIFDKRQNLDATFSMLLYMGNVAYLNNDAECTKIVFKHLRTVLNEKKQCDNLNSEKMVNFLFKHLPKRIQKSKEASLQLYDFIHNKGKIILIMQLLCKEASNAEVNFEQRQTINFLGQKFLTQAKDYAVH